MGVRTRFARIEGEHKYSAGDERKCEGQEDGGRKPLARASKIVFPECSLQSDDSGMPTAEVVAFLHLLQTTSSRETSQSDPEDPQKI